MVFRWSVPIIFLLFSSFAFAETFEELFNTGLTAYQKADYTAAQTAFSQALLQKNDDTSTMTNLALAHYQLGQRGWALGYLRKVLSLDPSHSEARQTLSFIMKEGKVRDIPHQIETWESFRSGFLSHLTWSSLTFLVLLIFLGMGWTWLGYMGARRRAIKNETAMPGFPILASLFSVLLVVGLSLILALWKDSSEARATIVVEKVAALTAPSETSPSLFELFEGLEVLVRQVKGDWIQVTYPGALTGWIPKASLFVTHSTGGLP